MTVNGFILKTTLFLFGAGLVILAPSSSSTLLSYHPAE